MVGTSAKTKNGQKKSAFKAFGNFFAMHMMKKLVTKRSKVNSVSADKGPPLEKSEKEALEAGFVSSDGNSQMSRSGSVSSTSTRKIFRANENVSNHNGVDLSSIKTVPGVFGLVNHGNTCFINSILQCLSNTDVLAEFFVLGQYKIDLKNCRKDRSKKYGTKGEVTEQMANVVRSLWTGTYTQDMTKHLKESIAKFASQYKGNLQHDSQEFLLWLFDKMHEDLNMMPVKKFSLTKKQSFYKRSQNGSANKKVTRKPSDGTQEVDMTPTSFIQKTFQGQYQSSLICPNCKKMSHTKDPFLCISLPIKQRTTRPVYVNVVYLPSKRKSGSYPKSCGKVVKIGVEIRIDGKVNDLRQAVASECGIHSRLIAFVELEHDGFHNSYGDEHAISDISSIATNNASSAVPLYAFEMPHIQKLTAGTLPRNFASRYNRRSKKEKNSVKSNFPSQDSIVILLINKHGVKEQGKRFGPPLVFRVNKDILQSDLQSHILSMMIDYLKSGIKSDKMGSLFRLQVLEGLPNKCYISQQAQQPLLLPTVDKALENCPAGGPMHIKLMAEWDNDTRAGIFDKIPEEKTEVQESVRLQRVLQQQPVTCTLEECFDLYTEAEELGPDDSWLCPHCHKQQTGTVKKLSLFSLPDVLVLHLKRFRVSDGKRTKLCTRVDFPVTGLDISRHIYCDSNKPTLFNKHNDWNGSGEVMHPPTGEEYLYDLYAVCNHFGNLNSGHYTACCSNPLNGKWYQFDDSNTDDMVEADLSSQAAYILFYQRRSSTVALSCGGMSTNSIMSDHWAFNLPQLKQKIKFISQSQLNHNSVQAPSSFEKKSPSSGGHHGNGSVPNLNPVMSNISKIGAAVNHLQIKPQEKADEKQDESDEGGFDAPRRPYVRGLRRQGSAGAGKGASGERTNPEELRGRQYRSVRNHRRIRQQTSPV